jgi:hypothetical protein
MLQGLFADKRNAVLPGLVVGALASQSTTTVAQMNNPEE